MSAHPAVAALLRDPQLQRLLAALDDPAEETRIVGGAIRNALIGRAIRDVDFATTIRPESMMRRARAAGLKAVPTGIEHGTVTVLVEGRAFEVTTLREDVETDGRHAVVRFGRDFEADAHRRDFTINALSAGADGAVHDYAAGLGDLAARRVRFIGDPDQRIREDFLRILRFFRFTAEYAQGPLDAAGLAAASRQRGELAGLSPERVRAETLKLFAAARGAEIVGALSDHGFAALLYGAAGERGRLQRAAGEDAVGRLGAFAVSIVEDSARLRDLLRLSNAETARLEGYASLLARLKSPIAPIDVPELRRLVVEHGAEPLRAALTILAGEPLPVLDASATEALARFVSGADAAPVFPLRAADFMAAGVPPGPALGEALRQARAQWLRQGCPDAFALPV